MGQMHYLNTAFLFLLWFRVQLRLRHQDEQFEIPGVNH